MDTAIATNRSRLVLRANATFSTVGGVIAVVAAGWLSDVSGIDHVAITRLGGIGLLLFAADVFRQSRLPEHRLPFALLQTSIADASWVVATVVVLAMIDLTGWGVAGAIVIAAAVADFGIAQLWLRETDWCVRRRCVHRDCLTRKAPWPRRRPEYRDAWPPTSCTPVFDECSTSTAPACSTRSPS